MADYIDRKALRDALYEQDAVTMRDVEIINRFPASDVVLVRHGRWLTAGHLPWCSLCGSVVVVDSRFCPYCGARMDGGEKNG